MLGISRSVFPVSLEPVKASTSSPPRCVRRSPGAPVTSESTPAGSALASVKSLTIRKARGAAELHGVAVEEEALLAELLGEISVVSERARGAVDVELGVAAGVAGVE